MATPHRNNPAELPLDQETSGQLTEGVLDRQSQIELNKGAVHLLETWLANDEDDEEQRDTLAYLVRSLDEDRLSECA